MSLDDDKNIDLRIAAALRRAADILEHGESVLAEVEPGAKIAAAVATIPTKQKTAATPKKQRRDWQNERLVSATDANQSNVYQILSAAYGVFTHFDLRDFTTSPGNRASKKLFQYTPSLKRMLNEMKELERCGNAVAVDKEHRLIWMLLK